MSRNHAQAQAVTEPLGHEYNNTVESDFWLC